MIERLLSLPTPKSFFLFGPRQTGKSTLIRAAFERFKPLHYDLLHGETYRRLLARPEQLREEVTTSVQQRGLTHVVIDEVQKVPQLLDEVHALIEQHKAVSFIMSGSSARKLKRAHANMLGGRAWTLKLAPLLAREIGSSFNLDRALRFGTLPSVYLADTDEDRTETLRSYVDTYIREEIELEAHIRNVGGFLRFLSMAASTNGDLLSYTNISREASVSSQTVKSYYQILEDTLLGHLLLPYGKSVRSRTAQHARFYFFDTGVVGAITKRLAIPMEEGSPEYGRAFEHFIVCEILRLNDCLRLDLDLSFYRTEAGAEVDCIIDAPSGATVAIEIKATTAPSSSHCRGLRSFRECVPKARCILACRCPHPVQIGPVTALPWEQALDVVSELR